VPLYASDNALTKSCVATKHATRYNARLLMVGAEMRAYACRRAAGLAAFPKNVCRCRLAHSMPLLDFCEVDDPLKCPEGFRPNAVAIEVRC